jgi:hypothetical protein
VDLAAAGLSARDVIEIDADSTVRCVLDPGVGAQAGSAAMIANSVNRVVAAPSGWLTVGDLPPAFPRLDPQLSGVRIIGITQEETTA